MAENPGLKEKQAKAGKVIEDDPEEEMAAAAVPTVSKKAVPRQDTVDEPDYDFVERPSEDFFCPVMMELLLDPYQTTCCGHHLSLEAVTKLKEKDKPCPMCKEPHLATVHDKFYGRKVSEVKVYCTNKSGGCEWSGEVRELKRHVESCLKRVWKCRYCDFSSTVDAETEHVMNCVRYPTDCPNQCGVTSLPRCDVEEHLAVCPLEVVDCEFVEAGCTVRTTRQNLKQHMEESGQQHLLSATLQNLKLTKETIVEKDRQLAEKDRQLAEKDRQIQELQEQMKLIGSFHLVKVGVDRLLGGMKHCHEFTLNKISQWKDWLSEPFYSHRGGYLLKLSAKKEKTSGFLFRGTTLSNILVGLVLCKGENDDVLTWPVTIYVDLQLVDQLNKQKHYQKSYEYFYAEKTENDTSSEHVYFVSRAILYPDGERSLYVHSDCIKLRLWLHLK